MDRDIPSTRLRILNTNLFVVGDSIEVIVGNGLWPIVYRSICCVQLYVTRFTQSIYHQFARTLRYDQPISGPLPVLVKIDPRRRYPIVNYLGTCVTVGKYRRIQVISGGYVLSSRVSEIIWVKCILRRIRNRLGSNQLR